MGRGDVPCHIIGKVFDENQQIMDLIDELAAEKEQNKAQLQRILDRIYRNIARYGDASEGKQSVEAYVNDGWRGLLNTINAILRLPATDFYEDDTADEDLADLYELCTEADDVLLGALRKIWICSGQTELFDWVFTEHRIDRPIRQLDAEIAVFLSLQGYKRRFSKRQKGERCYYSEPDDKENYKLYTGPKPRWHSEGTGLDPDWNWKLEGNAKPITGGIPYTIDLLDDRGDTIDDWVNVFRRSWQFCLDAQQIAEGNLGSQRREVLNTILLRHRIPREIHREILSYLTDREPLPYLKKLDIGAAYTRRERLKDRNLIYSEPFRDWYMVGVLGGLVGSMLHGRVLWKAWNEGHDDEENDDDEDDNDDDDESSENEGPQEAGTHSEPAKWAVGRNLLAQRVAEMVIKDLHSWPGRCEWCE
ncbi:hypothetical protein ACKRZS_001703 [Fusarium odoratissimum]